MNDKRDKRLFSQKAINCAPIASRAIVVRPLQLNVRDFVLRKLQLTPSITASFDQTNQKLDAFLHVAVF